MPSKEFELELKLLGGSAAKSELRGLGASARRAFDGVNEGARRAGRGVAQFTRRARRRIRELSKEAREFGAVLGRGAALVGAGAVLSGGLLAGGITSSSVADAREYSAAIAEVSTILPDAARDTQFLADATLELAKAYGQNETIVASGLYQTISAGVTEASDALFVLEEATRLGIAGVSDTETAVDLLTTVLNAYRLEIDAAGDVSDSLFTTVRLGKTTIEELGGSLASVIPSAATLGVSIEEIGAAIATLTAQGTPTAEATTQLRALLVALTKQSDTVDGALGRVGESYDLTTVRTRGFQAVVDDIRASLINEAEAFEVLGGRVEGYNALLGLTGQNSNAFTAALDAQAEKAGAVNDALELITSTSSFKVQRATNALRISFIDLGVAIDDALAAALDEFGGVENLTKEIEVTIERMRPEIEGLLVDLAGAAREWLNFTGDSELALAKADLLVARITIFAQTIEGIFTALASGIVSAADFGITHFANRLEDTRRTLRDLGGEIGEAFSTAEEKAIRSRIEVLRDQQRELTAQIAGEQLSGASDRPQSDFERENADFVERASRAGAEAAQEALNAGRAERASAIREELDALEEAYAAAGERSPLTAFGGRDELLERLEARSDGVLADVLDIEKALKNAADAEARIADLEGSSAERAQSRIAAAEAERAAAEERLEVRKREREEVAAAKRLVEETVAAVTAEGPSVILQTAEQLTEFETVVAQLNARSAVTEGEKIEAARTLLGLEVRRLESQAGSLELSERQIMQFDEAIERFREVAEAAIDPGSQERTNELMREYQAEIDKTTGGVRAQRAEIQRWSKAELERIALLEQDNLLTADQAVKLREQVNALAEARISQISSADTLSTLERQYNALDSAYDTFLRGALRGNESLEDSFKKMVANALIELAALELKLATLEFFELGGSGGGGGGSSFLKTIVGAGLSALVGGFFGGGGGGEGGAEAGGGGEGGGGEGGGGGAEAATASFDNGSGFRGSSEGFGGVTQPDMGAVMAGAKPEDVSPLARMAHGDIGTLAGGGGVAGNVFHVYIEAVDTQSFSQAMQRDPKTFEAMFVKAATKSDAGIGAVRQTSGGRGRGL